MHGDLGRTVPSVGSLLNSRADILQLDVTNVEDRWTVENGEEEPRIPPQEAVSLSRPPGSNSSVADHPHRSEDKAAPVPRDGAVASTAPAGRGIEGAPSPAKKVAVGGRVVGGDENGAVGRGASP